VGAAAETTVPAVEVVTPFATTSTSSAESENLEEVETEVSTSSSDV
jgi:hypothetical protein